MDEITKIIIASVLGCVIGFIINKFLSRGDDSLDGFGKLMTEKFNGMNDKVSNLTNLMNEIKTDKKEGQKGNDQLRIDMMAIDGKIHQISQAIQDVDTSHRKEIVHLKETFALYGKVLDHFMRHEKI